MTTSVRRAIYGRWVPAIALAGLLIVSAGGCAPTMTMQEERELGDELAQELNEDLPIVEASAVSDYINRLGRSIADVADDRDAIDYTFYVVKETLI